MLSREGVVDLAPKEWHVENCHTAPFSAETHIQNQIPKLTAMCDKTHFQKHPTPFSNTHHPELDTSPHCVIQRNCKHKSLIGMIANWMITLSRFDIACAISTLPHCTLAPHEGHFEAVE
jgi:hypothetical protein